MIKHAIAYSDFWNSIKQ